ncbi:albusnodin/ikarugamycin family macrolactam cyclase [Nocardiopsis sp. CT-R113]|uniref:asparagine synthase (glutamine-hydrolyzing) n=1 Tax=Nocardiopsis codii TaxID=3065942 RepID=A0ABU7K947_9ACTN|nr:albusnodin/ikarugamycin family macrolactam cyclase [Nocardiopsis sp. CT-R113]MEE2038764.1 albusnodin/ikarugamycin family macrolactam cyclase [Nocardiopsis sp. CT-R113]
MEWFGGVVAATGSSPLRPASPSWSWALPCGEVWRVGPGTGSAVTVAEAGPVRGAVLGSHTVSADCLRAWLSAGRRSGPPVWPGAYAVVVARPGGAAVFADPAHALPLYFCELEGAVVWASSSRALAGAIGGGVGLAWVSSLLMDPAGTHGMEQSAFQRVRSVPPGHRLDVSAGGRATVARWWSPPGSVPRAEAVRLFGKALGEAVAVRHAQAEHLSCDLSGGLDSTTLCLLASKQVAGERPLTAWTVHPASRNHGGDLDHAREAVRERPDVNHVLLPLGEAELPYGGLERVPPTDEPAPATITSARHVFAYERIHSSGSTLHMTGDGGDALLMQSPDLVPRLAARGRVLRALRDLHGWAKLDRGSPLRLLSRLARGERGPSPRWLTPKARDMAASGPDRGAAGLLRGDAELLGLHGIGRTAHADAQFAASFGVRLESPFLDRAVLEAALAFRVGDRGSPWSYKPQLTEAMSDLLPEAIARRRTKGGTDADHHLGLRAHLPEVSALLDGWLAGHGLIDPRAVREELRMAASGRDTPWGLLEPVLAAEVWGRAVEAHPPPRWTRTPVRQEAGG